MGHSEGLLEAGVVVLEGMFVLSLRALKAGADDDTEDLSLKTEKAVVEEVVVFVLKEERVDCLMTLATEERRELLVQDVR